MKFQREAGESILNGNNYAPQGGESGSAEGQKLIILMYKVHIYIHYRIDIVYL